MNNYTEDNKLHGNINIVSSGEQPSVDSHNINLVSSTTNTDKNFVTRVLSCAVFRLLFMFCAARCSRTNLQRHYNDCLVYTFEYKLGEDRTEIVKNFFSEENDTKYGKIITKKLLAINNTDVIDLKFSIDQEEKYIKNALSHCGIPLKKGSVSWETIPSFVAYVQTGSSLYYCYSGCTFSLCKKVEPINISHEESYEQYEILDTSNDQEINELNDAEKLQLCSIKNCYKIRYAEEMKEIKENGKKYIRFHKNRSLSMFDQDVVLYRVDNFTDGAVGYYRSYLMHFEITYRYNEDERKSAAYDCQPHSLEALRKLYPGNERYMRDITTIEDDSRFKTIITKSFHSFPILQWVNKQIISSDFICGSEDKMAISKAIENHSKVVNQKFSCFFISNNIMEETGSILLRFFQLHLNELKNEVKDKSVDLKDEQNLHLFSFIRDSESYLYNYSRNMNKDLLNCCLSCLTSMIISLKNLSNTPMIKDCVTNILGKFYRTLQGSYIPLNENQIDKVKEFIQDTEPYSHERYGFYLSCTRIKLFNEKTETWNDSSIFLRDGVPDDKPVNDCEKMIEIFIDMKKRAEIAKLVYTLLNLLDETHIRESTRVISLIKEIETRESCYKSAAVNYLLSLSSQSLNPDTLFQISSTSEQNYLNFLEKKYNVCNYNKKKRAKLLFDANAFHIKLMQQYASLKKFLEEQFGNYLAMILIRHYNENGRWSRLHNGLAYDHVLGNFRAWR